MSQEPIYIQQFEMADIGNGSETGSGNGSVGGGAAIVNADCSMFTFVVYVAVFGTMVAFGLVGNSLSWFVLAWDRRDRGRVASFLLRTMAVADNLFLLAAGLAQISSALIFYIDTTARYQGSTDVTIDSPTTSRTDTAFHGASTTSNSSVPDPEMLSDYRDFDGTETRSLYDDVSAYVTAYITVCVFPIVHMTQMFTVWVTVLVAFSRYVAICRPYQAPRLCTMRRVRQQVVAVAAAILLYNAPRFFEFKVDHSHEQVALLLLTVII